jgi:signal transduction histidine kinase
MSLVGLSKSLSARLLVLTIFFVMLSEVLIYTPSIGRFRKVYLEERLAAAHLAALTLEATPEHKVGAPLEMKLLNHVQAYAIELRRGDKYTHMLGGKTPPEVNARFDLREATFFGYIGDAFMALAQGRNRVLHVTGTSPKDADVLVEIILDERPMRTAMLDYSARILQLSIVISLLTATLVYLSLQWLMVRPMGRITAYMTDFREAPEDVSRVIVPSRRSDEIGVAQRELARMQNQIRAALRQRARLAALGEAVTKINHDLRNILATAQLMSDRLAGSTDPEVKRVTPTFLSAIDRAVDLCRRVLEFARIGAPQLELKRFPLHHLITDVRVTVSPEGKGPNNGQLVEWVNKVASDFEIVADRDQLFRVLANLGRNAVEAGATRIEVAAAADGGVSISFRDNGPGLPESARETLFQPFSRSAKPGGSGLGLAIVRELMRAHGGDIRLVDSDEGGTGFVLGLPSGDGQK